MTKHVGIRRGLDGVMLVLISADQIAEGVEIHLLAIVELPFGEQSVHDLLGLRKMPFGFDRGQRKRQHKLKIRVAPLASLEAEFRLDRHFSLSSRLTSG